MTSRDHLAVLDALRGVAALAVLLYHFNHWLQIPWLAPNAGILVDFFFCLSGYIVTLAYAQRRTQDLTFIRFAIARLIRLMPIIVLSSLIAASYYLTRRLIFHIHEIPLNYTLLAGAVGAMCIPLFNAPGSIGGPDIFPLNGPEYTLFFEIFINFFWGATRRLSGVKSAIIFIVAGYSMTFFMGMGGNTPGNFLAGFPRIFGTFYAGVFVFLIQQKHPRFCAMARYAFWPAIATTAIISCWQTEVSKNMIWLWCLVVTPLLVLSGSYIRTRGKVRAAALLLGELSYPLYALHYPLFMWVNGTYQQILHQRHGMTEAIVIAPIIIGLSFLFSRLYEKPVRSFLGRLFAKKAPGANTFKESFLTDRARYSANTSSE